MNWWKKILSNFLSDKTTDQQPTINVNKQEIKKQNEMKDQSEMRTRVIYQYPKGEFRFPLIKDQTSRERPSQNNRQQESRQPKTRERTQSKVGTSDAPRRKIEPKSHQPFEPTHIPSPIYGFKRPANNEEVFQNIPENELKETDQIGNVHRLIRAAQNKELIEQTNEKIDESREWTEESVAKTASTTEKQSELSIGTTGKSWELEDTIDDKKSIEREIEENKTTEAGNLHPYNAVEKLESYWEEEKNKHLEIDEGIYEESDTHDFQSNVDEESLSEESDPKQALEAAENSDYVTELGSSYAQTDSALTETVEESDIQVPQSNVEEEALSEESDPEQALGAAETSDYVTELESSCAQTDSALTETVEESDIQVPQSNIDEEIFSQAEPEQSLEAAENSDYMTELESSCAQTDFALTESVEESDIQVPQPNVDEEVFSQAEPERAEISLEAEERIEAETKPEDASIAEQPLEQERPASKEDKPRTHLPFNVLMLTQDRTNWQKQKNKEKRTGDPIDQAKAETAATKQETPTLVNRRVNYEFPALQLLEPPVIKEENKEWLEEQSALLDETMENFNVKARVVNASQGPSVTRFEVQPDKGVKVNKITNLSNDIKLSMAARDIRMEAPIPGTRSIGIELPNKDSRPVQISEIIGKEAFLHSESPLTAVLGLGISGEPVVTDLRKMPHGLIAGATGSGKSVCINSILVSLLYKARPDELKLMLIDPKMVELAPYNHIPHLVSPVITDVKAATAALKWAVDEMERRYELFVHAGVRDIGRFNELAERHGQKGEHLPYIVIVIDELADLMMVAPAEVEESICRIAQKARACGIHLLIATQRPSVDVITGLIKANVPTRIAFAVSSQVDSRTVIDVSGAEKLLGRGDMLFLNNGSVKPVRLQGTFVSDEEIDRVIDHVRSQGKPNYLFEEEELLKKAEIQENEDELLMDACEFVVKQGNASTSLLQRQFRIGYNRAARLMEMMEDQGVISGARGSKPRDVLMKEAELELLKQ